MMCNIFTVLPLRRALPGFACIITLLAGPLHAAAADADADLRAQQAIGEFQQQLQQALRAAMQAGGPVAAITVCRDQAPQIAAQTGARLGLQLRRISQRNRNPDNAADDAFTPLLDQFAMRLQAGEPVSALHARIDTGSGNTRQSHYLQAISTQAMCLGCHGKTLAPAVQAALHAHYPADRATGYSEGELRGAFVVSTPTTQ